ncbi:MAG: CocE/NonD family hydrolase [Curtobacterium sp.]
MPDAVSAIAERREVLCRMRDGIRLRTVLLIPSGDGPWPALLTRHPYDVSRDELGGRIDVERLVASGYLVALQDVRGRYGSEGRFDPSAQEVEDGADAVAWLAALPECSGAVGMWGASYASETQFSALLGGAPALRSIVPAVTPVASGLNGFRFRGGVPEIGSMFAWSHWAIGPDRIARIDEPGLRAEEQARWDAVDRDIADGSAFASGSLALDRKADETLRWMRDRLREPLSAEAHRDGKVIGRYDAVTIPVLLIGGWFDVFLGSTLEVHRRLSELAPSTGVVPHLVIGPWSHDDMTGRLGGVDFGPSASADRVPGSDDLTDLHVRWFDATLRGGAPSGPALRLFLMGADRWIEPSAFPPADAVELALHLGSDGTLSSAAGAPGACQFTSDPGDPVPTRGGATLLFPPFAPGPVDQAELERRGDVLSWRTGPVESDLTVLGPVRAIVHLTTTGTDADVVVRLCDEHPDGTSRVVVDGIQRASARAVDPWTGEGERAPLEPDVAVEIAVDLWATAHVFRPGHRLRLDVAPSSSPRWEVGRNRFAAPGDPVAPVVARCAVLTGPATPSRVVLSVPTTPPLAVPPGTRNHE